MMESAGFAGVGTDGKNGGGGERGAPGVDDVICAYAKTDDAISIVAITDSATSRDIE